MQHISREPGPVRCNGQFTGQGGKAIRGKRDGLTGLPQEQQHSAASYKRDAGPTAPRELFCL